LLIPPHPNLNRFYGSAIIDDTIINFVDPILGDSLYAHIQRNSLSEETKLSVILQIIDGLIFLQKRFMLYRDILETGSTIKFEGFFHGDLHADNILITDDKRAIIIDWGQAYRTHNRSQFYSAIGPEFYPGSEHLSYRGSLVDMFSLGVLIWYAFEGKVPFGETNYFEKPQDYIVDLVRDRKFGIPNTFLKLGKQFQLIVKQMLSYDPRLRPDIEEVRKLIYKIYSRKMKKKCHIEYLYIHESHIRKRSDILTTAYSLLGIAKKGKKLKLILL